MEFKNSNCFKIKNKAAVTSNDTAITADTQPQLTDSRLTEMIGRLDKFSHRPSNCFKV